MFNIENCEIAAFISQTKQEIYSGAEIKANGGKTIVLGTLTTQDNIIVSGTKEQEKDFFSIPGLFISYPFIFACLHSFSTMYSSTKLD